MAKDLLGEHSMVWTIPRIYYFFLIAIVARKGSHVFVGTYWCPFVVGTVLLSILWSALVSCQLSFERVEFFVIVVSQSTLERNLTNPCHACCRLNEAHATNSL